MTNCKRKSSNRIVAPSPERGIPFHHRKDCQVTRTASDLPHLLLTDLLHDDNSFTAEPTTASLKDLLIALLTVLLRNLLLAWVTESESELLQTAYEFLLINNGLTSLR